LSWLITPTFELFVIVEPTRDKNSTSKSCHLVMVEFSFTRNDCTFLYETVYMLYRLLLITRKLIKSFLSIIVYFWASHARHTKLHSFVAWIRQGEICPHGIDDTITSSGWIRIIHCSRDPCWGFFFCQKMLKKKFCEIAFFHHSKKWWRREEQKKSKQIEPVSAHLMYPS